LQKQVVAYLKVIDAREVEIKTLKVGRLCFVGCGWLLKGVVAPLSTH
jgi:hypothetical protein